MRFSSSLLSTTLALAPIVHSHSGLNETCPSPTKYPNRCQITDIFNNLGEGNFTAFFEHVADDVHWTLMGTHPLAGQYHDRTLVIVDAIERLANTIDSSHPSGLVLTNVIGGGNEEWSVQELHGTGRCKNGLVYDNRFAWITRWSTQGILVENRAYLDSALVYKAVTENESSEYKYTDTRNKLKPGPSGSNCKVSLRPEPASWSSQGGGRA